MTETDPRGVGELLKDLRDQMSRLVRQEVELAQVETAEKISRVARNAALVAAAAVLAHAALLLALAGLALLLRAALIALGVASAVAAWAAVLLLALLLAALAAGIAHLGVLRLRATGLAPRRTANSLKESREWLQTKLG